MNRVSRLVAAVDENLAMPLYHQVYLVLREGIRNGAYAPGAVLPAEMELCSQFGVSRITIKRAMQQLTSEGLVSRQRGRGTFVSSTPVAAAQNDALDDLLQNVMAIGAATEMRRLDGGTIPAPADVAARLQTDTGKPVFCVRQVRLSKGEPIALITAYVPEAVAGRIADIHTSQTPMLAQIQKAGIAVARADQSITATLADPATASHLGIDVGAPLIRLTRLVFDDAEKPVEWLIALYRADRYEYRTSLTHNTAGSRSTWESV